MSFSTKRPRNLNRVRGGLKAKNEGRYFEQLSQSVLTRRGWNVIAIPQGGKMVGGGKFIRTRSPFDFIATRKSKAVFFDTKSTDESTFSFSMCTAHQLESLYRIEKEGFWAGYVVYFRRLEKVVFFKASSLKALAYSSGIMPENGISLGHPFHMDFEELFKVE